jgi:hypothetical protein
MRLGLLVLVLVLVSSGCGAKKNPLDDPTLTSAAANPNDAKVWNSYNAEGKTEYRYAFDLCNGWVDTSSPRYTPDTPGQAADYATSHEDANGNYTAAGQGCVDGIAGLPLGGSGIPVPH